MFAYKLSCYEQIIISIVIVSKDNMPVAILVFSKKLIWGMWHAASSIGSNKGWCHAPSIIGRMHIFNNCMPLNSTLHAAPSGDMQLGVQHTPIDI
jgi:hypothetical protein